MTDELDFFLPKSDPYSIVISLTYYTHQMYFDGREMRDINE